MKTAAPFLLVFVPVLLVAQSVQYTDVADPDYYVKLGTLQGSPLYRDDKAVSKRPAFAELGSPTGTSDSISQYQVHYSWPYYSVMADSGGNQTIDDGYLVQTEVATASDIVDYAQSLIGTPWEGATCAALLDAGFVEPCQIPPLELPDVEAAPNPTLTSCKRGYQTPHTSNSQVSTGGLLSDCIVDGVAYWATQYAPPTFPNVRLARTTCTGSTTKVLTYYIRWGTNEGSHQIGGNALWTGSPSCFNLFVADPLSTHVQGTFDPYDPEPEQEPVESDDTDGQLLYKLDQAGLITSNYLLNQATGEYTYFTSSTERVESTIPQNWIAGNYQPSVQFEDTPPVDVTPADAYQYSYSWGGVGGDPDPTPTPTPTPDPSPVPGDGGQGDCQAFPNSLGCMPQSTFFDSLSDTAADVLSGFTVALVGDTDLTEYDDYELGTQAVDPGDFVPVELASVSGCPAPPSLEFFGQVYELDNTMACDAMDQLSPIVILICTFSAMFIVVGARGGVE